MRVYALRATVLAPSGLSEPVAVIAGWLSTKLRYQIAVKDILVTCQRRFARPFACNLEIVEGIGPEGRLHSTRLTHADSAVHGRQWRTEVGIKELAGGLAQVSILVETDEVSTRVTQPALLRPPRLVTDLFRVCAPVSGTPGTLSRELDQDSAPDVYHYEVMEPDRSFPLVIVSPRTDGSYVVAQEMLRSLLAGLCDVLVIPPSADTWAIARHFHAVPAPYRGAVTIVMPPWQTPQFSRVPAIVLTESDLTAPGSESPELEVVQRVTHRTNLPMSWGHVSPDKVREAVRTLELNRLRESLKSHSGDSEVQKYFEEITEENVSPNTHNRPLRNTSKAATPVGWL